MDSIGLLLVLVVVVHVTSKAADTIEAAVDSRAAVEVKKAVGLYKKVTFVTVEPRGSRK